MNKKQNAAYSRTWRKMHPGKNAQFSKNLREKRKQLWHKLKINGCAICGYDKCDAVLDFHHTNPEDKKFQMNITASKKYSNDEIANELNKCILLCCRCHGEIHWCNKEVKEK